MHLRLTAAGLLFFMSPLVNTLLTKLCIAFGNTLFLEGHGVEVGGRSVRLGRRIVLSALGRVVQPIIFLAQILTCLSGALRLAYRLDA